MNKLGWTGPSSAQAGLGLYFSLLVSNWWARNITDYWLLVFSLPIKIDSLENFQNSKKRTFLYGEICPLENLCTLFFSPFSCHVRDLGSGPPKVMEFNLIPPADKFTIYLLLLHNCRNWATGLSYISNYIAIEQ